MNLEGRSFTEVKHILPLKHVLFPSYLNFFINEGYDPPFRASQLIPQIHNGVLTDEYRASNDLKKSNSP